MSTLRIAEIFGPTIQGEGALIGEPSVFVRAGGCDYRCRWCDSLHAVDSAFRHEWAAMETEEVWARVHALSGGVPLTVSLSGGNPAIQPFGPLIALGRAAGYRFALETQGSIARDWFAQLDMLVLSPKPPSSGEMVDWATFEDCLIAAGDGPKRVMKIIIFDEADYAFAREAAARYHALPLFLQPGNHTPPPPGAEDGEIDLDGIMQRMHWLTERTLADQWFTPRILPQLHVLMWGNRRGV
ncbi:7-carboxy-7-deazaguanine synthase [Paramesorhizobium deserti]|uniref:7-carboxy-7-deazaguanine synthase n=1 Tax=Paramesorhizobium deserti TaxID=1494590 RepID=A0A135HZB1_9HYPH|nr:7-carboxy-7-deazaguanine synthase QueE [Paramesorhizobium deserti]KXF78554.1 7-carboxy-7-deazaguanine synthase [Paramesorhizobium deserti]